MVVPSGSLAAGAVVPPPEVFQAPMRILKRPTASNTPTQSPRSLSEVELKKQLRDREAVYLKARERIFQTGSPADSASSLEYGQAASVQVDATNLNLSHNEISVQRDSGNSEDTAQHSSDNAIGMDEDVTRISRNPKGPSDGTSRGFRGKRGGRKRGSKGS